MLLFKCVTISPNFRWIVFDYSILPSTHLLHSIRSTSRIYIWSQQTRVFIYICLIHKLCIQNISAKRLKNEWFFLWQPKYVLCVSFIWIGGERRKSSPTSVYLTVGTHSLLPGGYIPVREADEKTLIVNYICLETK